MSKPKARLEYSHLTPKQRDFLIAYGQCGQVGHAAETAKVNRQSHHSWLRESESYRQAFRSTQELIGSMAEDAAVERAIFGVQRLVTYKGRAIKVNGKPLYETNYSDQLLLAVLRRFLPEYRERTATEHSGSVECTIVERLQAARQRLLEFREKESA
jgi:hypothetical protein